MQLTVNGVGAEIDAATFSETSFDKRVTAHAWPYALIVEAEDFFRRFRPIYTDGIAELLNDDQITGVFHPPYEGAESYPSLEGLLSLSEPLRMKMIDAFFALDILKLYLPEDAFGGKVKWVVASLDSVARHEDKIVILGRVVEA